jgi:hypothetical protein
MVLKAAASKYSACRKWSSRLSLSVSTVEASTVTSNAEAAKFAGKNLTVPCKPLNSPRVFTPKFFITN